MKIKYFRVKNDEILGDLQLDFADVNGKALNTIILAGQNGVGKSRILNLIYEFSHFDLEEKDPSCGKTIVVELSDEEEEVLIAKGDPIFSEGIKDGELTFDYDYTEGQGSWTQIGVTFKDNKGAEKKAHGGVFGRSIGGNNESLRISILKSIFSDVEINFSPNSIHSVTAQDVDQGDRGFVKSSGNLATEINQLLVDISALDASDVATWVIENPNEIVPTEILENRRMKRFTDAYDFMFPSKKYKGIRNVEGTKQIFFEENGKEIPLNKLSSGEKQIIFRGSFLLKDKKSNQGALVLIDEPEISLHPEWQIKISEFYKRLFSDENGKQTSQLFIATHSPFIIHNSNRTSDKVIILKKSEQGKLVIPDKTEYFGWTSKKEVAEAFNIDLERTDKPLLLTEGKSDALLLKTAWSKLFKDDLPFEIVSVGIESNEDERSGNADLVKRTLELIANAVGSRKIIGLFDNDREGYEQFKGLNSKVFGSENNGVRKHLTKNVLGVLLTAPDSRRNFVTENSAEQRYLEIEHLFSDQVLETNNLKGESILHTDVFGILSKKYEFALKAKDLTEDKFENFRPIFEKIKTL